VIFRTTMILIFALKLNMVFAFIRSRKYCWYFNVKVISLYTSTLQNLKPKIHQPDFG